MQCCDRASYLHICIDCNLSCILAKAFQSTDLDQTCFKRQTKATHGFEPTWPLARWNKFYSSHSSQNLWPARRAVPPLCAGNFKSLLWLPPISWPRHFAWAPWWPLLHFFWRWKGWGCLLHIWVLPFRSTKSDHERTFQHLPLAKVFHNNICYWCHRALPPLTFNPPILVGHWTGFAYLRCHNAPQQPMHEQFGIQVSITLAF